MKITSKIIIDNRNKISKELTKYWNIIRTENLMPKNGKRNYDLKALLEIITKLSEKRINAKLYLQCINMGLTSKDDIADIKENSIYPIIYTLSEKNEMLVQLGLIPTLNPRVKSKKGKKVLFLTEEITSAYIKKLKAQLQVEINELEKALEDFNKDTEIELDDKENNYLLAA